MSRGNRRAAGPDATVVPGWHSAYNAIVNPKHYVAFTLYYVKNWLPQIGENGHLILTALRSHGFYDPASGTCRDGIDIDQRKLAEECGMSLRTLQREFAANAVLARFVQREFAVVRDSAGRIVREHYLYRVKMDDPLTPEDQARLDALLVGPDKTAGPPASSPEPPIRQNGGSGMEPICHSDASARQNDTPGRHFDAPLRQNGGSYKVDSATLATLATPATAAPGDSASLFPEEEAGPGGAARGAAGRPRPWADLPDEERVLWRDRARPQVEAGRGEMDETLWQRIFPKLWDQRARHLYEDALRRAASGPAD